MEIKELINENIHIIKSIREELSKNAELAFREFKTQKIILDFLSKLDIDLKISCKTGVIGVLNKNTDCIGIRVDMDALPVNGVSHVCGHDYHMAIALGVALILKKINYEKNVKFIFQPAEEGEGGALPMIKEGALDSPLVKNIIGFHLWPNVKIGTIEVSSGPSMASVDDFKITFKGKGGHAAMPHLCKNPLYPAMDFIQTMNTKTKLNIDPLYSHVVTFASLQCGNSPNVIANECTVLGTVRTFDSSIRSTLYEEILKTSSLCAENYNCRAEVEYDFQYPPLISDEGFTNKFINITKAAIGENNVLPLERTFAAEDFSFFAEKIPSVHFRLGISNDLKGIHPLHSPNFDADENALYYGIYVIVNFLLAL